MSEQPELETTPSEEAGRVDPARAAEDAAHPESARPTAGSGPPPGLDVLLDVPLRVTVEIGSARMLVQEVLQLGPGSVIELDRMAGEPADLLVNGRVVARGEVVVSDDRLSIRVVEITGGSPSGDGAN